MTRIISDPPLARLPARSHMGLRPALQWVDNNPPQLIWVGIALCILIFLLDLVFPLGVAAGVPYVAVVLLGLWIPERRYRYLAGVTVTLLTVVGFFIPYPIGMPIGSAFWIGLENRAIALTSIWITALLVDVAVRRNELVREREGRLQAVLDAAVDAVVLLDESGIVETCNPAACELFQYEPTEMLGLPLERLLSLPGRESLPPAGISHRLAFGIHQWHQREAQAMRKDGTTFPVDPSFSEVKLRDQRLYAGILRDITERKRTQRRLVQSESLAAIGEAITGLAHESRNALQRSQACIELLGDYVADNTEAQTLVVDIQQAQDELNYLYEKVRNYAAPRRLHAHSCCLETLARQVWQMLEPTRASRQAELEISDDSRDRVVEADPFALKQLLRNIFENSLAASSGPLVIRVQFAATTWQGVPALEMRLADNGPGIPLELRERVFEPFFTTHVRGTGLGLAICKRIVDDHGGEIRLGEQADSGAEFIVTLRRCLN